MHPFSELFNAFAVPNFPILFYCHNLIYARHRTISYIIDGYSGEYDLSQLLALPKVVSSMWYIVLISKMSFVVCVVQLMCNAA